jgi:hypothetical protein
VEGGDLKASAMTNRSPNAARGLRGVGLSAAWLAGVGTAGAVVSMREAYPRAPRAAPAEGWPPATPVPEGRLAVAVMLGDLAGHSDQTTAQVTAKSIEYPTEQLELAGAGWPWRPTALLALTATAAIGVALLPAAATRRNRR